jgi:hypothetical protein
MTYTADLLVSITTPKEPKIVQVLDRKKRLPMASQEAIPEACRERPVSYYIYKRLALFVVF